jgi:pimeloyl-ACP methyl ester carboxylesterase
MNTMKIKVYLTGITAIAAAGLVLALSLFALPELAVAQDMQPLSITMEGYDYPYPVTYLPLTIEGQDLRMAYMDVAPEGSGNGRTVVLLHGKNFFGAYWRDTISALAHDGYRVIVPDQIGFGKSSKPNIHYSFHLLAATTNKVLEAAGVSKVAVVGHSMGGMLATRFALMYPQMVTHLVLEDPIGLEDYRAFVPYASIEEIYKSELNATAKAIRNYHKGYYVQWRPEYDEYPMVAIRWKGSGEYPRLAMSSALTYQMIYEQPVCHEFSQVKVKDPLDYRPGGSDCGRQGQGEEGTIGKSWSVSRTWEENREIDPRSEARGDPQCGPYSPL